MTTEQPTMPDQSRIARCLADGTCVRCVKPKEPQRMKNYYCLSCQRKRAAATKAWLNKDMLQPELRPYAGMIPCRAASCSVTFYSQDRRRITRCPACHERLYRQEGELACDEARYDENCEREGNVYTKTMKHVGAMTSAKSKAIMGERQQDDYVGIPFRQLSSREITETYTPERIAVMLVRAKKNQPSGWVPDERLL